MSTYEDSLIEDRDELVWRLKRLSAFLGSDDFYQLSKEEQSRLNRLRTAMSEYRSILDERIDAL